MVDNPIPNSGGAPPAQNPPPQAPPAAPPAPQYGQPQYAQAPTYPAPPRKSMLEEFASPSKVATFVFIGLILVMVGMIILSSTNFLDITDNDYRDNYSTMTGIGWILTDLGMFAVSAFLLLGGILQKTADRYMKIGMLVAAGLTLMAWFSAFV